MVMLTCSPPEALSAPITETFNGTVGISVIEKSIMVLTLEFYDFVYVYNIYCVSLPTLWVLTAK